MERTPITSILRKRKLSLPELERGERAKITVSEVGELMSSVFGEHWEEQAEIEPISIQKGEIPFMISHKGELICYPKSLDEPNTGVFGQRGQGKTYFSCSFLSRKYYYGDARLAILNDGQSETYSWSRPNEDRGQVKTLEMLGERPMPLPIVYCLPSTATASVGKRDHLLISLRLDEVMLRSEQFLDLGKSAKYFKEKIDQVMECSTLEEILYIIKEIKKTKIKVGF